MSGGSETITVKPAVEEDWQGDPVGPAIDPYDIAGCVVIPRYSREAETIVTGYTVMLWRPEGVRKIQSDDRIICRGDEWDVDGEAGDYISRRGVYKGTELKLTRVGEGVS